MLQRRAQDSLLTQLDEEAQTMQANTGTLVASQSQKIQSLEAQLNEKEDKIQQLREQLRKSMQDANDLRLQQI